MEIDDAERLANEIDSHCMALLRSSGKQAAAIEWMKTAFNLLEQCSKDLRRPRVFAVHNGFGCATYTLERPTGLVLPRENFNAHPPVWIGGKTIAYGEKYQDRANIPWTIKDGRRLVAERERKAKMTKLGRPKG